MAVWVLKSHPFLEHGSIGSLGEEYLNRVFVYDTDHELYMGLQGTVPFWQTN